MEFHTENKSAAASNNNIKVKKESFLSMKNDIKTVRPAPTTKEGKSSIIKAFTPKSKKLKNSTLAFLFGAMLCGSAEGLRHLFIRLGAKADGAAVYVSLVFIALSAALTAFGIFDRLARVGGAGLLVPITGFSNSVVSVALDSRSEGRILGVGSKLFTVAGPVISYGVLASAIYGFVYYILPFLV